MLNPFFKNNGPFKIFDILEILKLNKENFDTKTNVLDIKDLLNAKQNEITFFHSKKYNEIARNTKASFCITTENLKNELPNNCVPLIVKNVLVSTSLITSKFYPDSTNDDFDQTVKKIDLTRFKENVKFGSFLRLKGGITLSLHTSMVIKLYT